MARIFSILLVSISLIISSFSVSQAHEVNARVIAIGEDEDAIAVPKTNEIYKRVIMKMQEALLRHKIFVIDEDMVAVKLGFDIPSRRSKTDILQMMQVVNTTTDATVQTRLLVLFSIIPNIQEMDFTRKLTVRVRGQIFDLATLRALSSFEVSNPESVPVPKKASLCNDLCVQEKAGEIAGDLTTELGAILIKKLEKIIESNGMTGSAGGGSTASSSETALGQVFTLKMKLFKRSTLLKVKKALEKTDGITEIKKIKGTETQNIYSVNTNMNLGDLEEALMEVLMENDVDIDNVNFKSFGTEISAEVL